MPLYKSAEEEFSPFPCSQNSVLKQEIGGIKKGMVNFLGKNWWDLWPNIWPYECKGNNSQVVTEEGAEDKNHIGRLTKEEKGARNKQKWQSQKIALPFPFPYF